MYRVIKNFVDLQDNNYVYSVGDIYPRDGVVVSPKRLDELSSNKNRRGIPLIERILEKEDETPVESPAPKKRRGKRK